MKTLIVLIGLQASGKSTFCRTVLKDYQRINLDELKTRHQERLAYEALLKAQDNIVIDNTNPSVMDRKRYIPQAKAAGYQIIGYYFESKVADCQKRNALRDETARVPALAIAGTSKKLQLPCFEEGFDELFYVSLTREGFDIQPWQPMQQALKFSDLSREMKGYEKANDWLLDRKDFLVVRLDGRNFSRLTKQDCDFKAPFDDRFHTMMLKTMDALIESGFRVVFAYSQSDEISLLLDNRQDMFGRRARKILSILAGTASAAFSLALGQMAIFDSRILSLPNQESVKRYFLWRWLDSKRNCLNAYAYWTLRNEAQSANEATEFLLSKNTTWKLKMLHRKGITLETIPEWQKTGTIFHYETQVKVTHDLKTGEKQTGIKQTKCWVDGINSQTVFLESLQTALDSIKETQRQKEALWAGVC